MAKKALASTISVTLVPGGQPQVSIHTHCDELGHCDDVGKLLAAKISALSHVANLRQEMLGNTALTSQSAPTTTNTTQQGVQSKNAAEQQRGQQQQQQRAT